MLSRADCGRTDGSSTVSALEGSSRIDGAVFELTQSDGVVERLAGRG
jgi:hypothetical protein